jgi:hypothetical protein
MKITEEIKRKLVNEVAGNYFSEQETGDNYDAYLRLCDVNENLQSGDVELACNYIEVWEHVDDLSVSDIINSIECGVETLKKLIDDLTIPNPIEKIDFTTLRTQKSALLTAMRKICNDKESDDLDGIVHLIDAIQDYAVDIMGISEMLVFDFEKEEKRNNK